MPFVSIRITREGATGEQKAQIIREVTDTPGFRSEAQRA
jgi:4-oxalocrotonate tautomerase